MINIRTEIIVGSEKQVNAGILAKAKVTFLDGAVPLVTLDDITIRRGNKVPVWVSWSNRQDPTGKKDENGYTVTYPNYRVYPESRDNRTEIENRVIAEYQKVVGGGGRKEAPAARQPAAPANRKPAVVPPAPATEADVMDDLDFNV